MILTGCVGGVANPPGPAERVGAANAPYYFARVVLRGLHRSDAAKSLREQLLSRGIPVCRGCGHSLRGHPPDSPRCPECGREVDDGTRELVRLASVLAAKR